MDLKEYITKVKNLEVLCYEQTLYIQRLENVRGQIASPRLINGTVAKKTNKESTWDYITCIPNGALVGLIVAVICWIKSGISFSSDIFKNFHIYFVGIGAGIGFIIYVLLKVRKYLDQEKLNEIAKKKNESIRLKNNKIQSCIPEKTQIIEKEILKARKKYKETYDILQQYYDLNVIFEKYRSMIPVCMFCEYLQSGRCSQLTGHEGAYNIYENELRMNIIINKLDDIIEKLDIIEKNQYILAHAIHETNKEINKLTWIVQDQVSILKDISSNVELTTYYSEISAVNTSYMAWLEYIKR